MASTELVTVCFTPTDAMETYRGTFAFGTGHKDVICLTAGEIEVTPEKADDMVATWPENFAYADKGKKSSKSTTNKSMTATHDKSAE